MPVRMSLIEISKRTGPRTKPWEEVVYPFGSYAWTCRGIGLSTAIFKSITMALTCRPLPMLAGMSRGLDQEYCTWYALQETVLVLVQNAVFQTVIHNSWNILHKLQQRYITRTMHTRFVVFGNNQFDPGFPGSVTVHRNSDYCLILLSRLPWRTMEHILHAFSD